MPYIAAPDIMAVLMRPIVSQCREVDGLEAVWFSNKVVMYSKIQEDEREGQ